MSSDPETAAMTVEDFFPGGDTLQLDLQICFPLYATSNMLMRLYHPALSGLGLTYPQYLVMLVLWEASPTSVGELGRRLYLNSGTLTPLLKRLEAAGLVLRQRDTADERRVQVHLTDKGAALRDRATHVPLTLGEKLDLSVDDLLVVRNSVRHLLEALGKVDPRIEHSGEGSVVSGSNLTGKPGRSYADAPALQPPKGRS